MEYSHNCDFKPNLIKISIDLGLKWDSGNTQKAEQNKKTFLYFSLFLHLSIHIQDEKEVFNAYLTQLAFTNKFSW